MTQEPAVTDLDMKQDIVGLTADSREVKPGYLFAALPGAKLDGRKFIKDALSRGAVAVLTSNDVSMDGMRIPSPLPLIRDPNPRRRLSLMAARFYGDQPETVAAVTGTNGKTSVAAFTWQIWTRLGLSAASLGTLGIRAPGYDRYSSLTTPDPVTLHKDLATLADRGVTHLALEASSHGLDQYRLDGIRIAAAAFTNLSRDHMDYHADMGAYLQAKARLFGELLEPDGTAVLNADSKHSCPIRKLCEERNIRVLQYGESAVEKDIRIERVEPQPDSLSITFTYKRRRFETTLPLAGDFQASNALCAFALVVSLGGDAEAAAAALDHLEGAPGRLQLVARHANGAAIYVDYAHTPDALKTVLKAMRPHTKNRLHVVFGCGGDRDTGKRPMMGQVANCLADVVIVTDDNPRSEDPAAIRRAVLAASPKAVEIGDRAEAIDTAVKGLQPGDLLVIAGKGHEQGQIVGDTVLPFDDTDVAREAAARTGATA